MRVRLGNCYEYVWIAIFTSYSSAVLGKPADVGFCISIQMISNAIGCNVLTAARLSKTR